MRQRVLNVFREVLEKPDLTLAETTKRADIPEWDSLAHVQIVVELQREFGTTFTSAEILSWQTFGDVLRTIEGKVR